MAAYTELEWNLRLQAPASGTQVYEFRVYSGSTPLETYIVTPQLTVSASIDLTVANATHLQTGGAVLLSANLVVATATQAQTAAATYVALSLLVANSAHLHTAAGITLSNLLVVADAAQAQTAGSPVLTWGLTVDNAVHAQTAEAVTFTDFDLNVANAAHLHFVSGIALNDGGTSLIVADASSAHTSAVVTFVSFSLEVANTTQTQTVDRPVFSALLSAANATHGQTAGAATLGTDLVVGDAAQSQTATDITVAAELAVDGTAHEQTVNPAPAEIQLLLTVANAIHIARADAPSLSPELLVASAGQFQTAQTVTTVGVVIALFVQSAFHVHRATSPTGATVANDAVAVYVGVQAAKSLYVGSVRVW